MWVGAAACRDKLVELTGHTLGVYSVSWSPDSQQLITASADKTVRLWDAASGECLTYAPPPHVSLSPSPAPAPRSCAWA